MRGMCVFNTRVLRFNACACSIDTMPQGADRYTPVDFSLVLCCCVRCRFLRGGKTVSDDSARARAFPRLADQAVVLQQPGEVRAECGASPGRMGRGGALTKNRGAWALLPLHSSLAPSRRARSSIIRHISQRTPQRAESAPLLSRGTDRRPGCPRARCRCCKLRPCARTRPRATRWSARPGARA